MTPRPKRRCVAKVEEQRVKTFQSAPDEAATDDDRAKWTGWSDLESEPAIFNSILSRWGVEGVETCEVTCMDTDILRSLPQPIYGIIFLYRYSDPEEDKSTTGNDDNDAAQDDQQPSAEEHVWFATQNMNNMCGSLALLNLVMNIPDLTLGDLLSRFRTDTSSMPPAERGDAVADFASLRRIHNSWAKKTDMLNQDLKLAQDAKKAQRQQRAGTKRKKSGSKKKKQDEQDDEMAYHFVAYVPVADDVWMLDGMEPRPRRLERGGRGDGDWLEQVASTLSDRMALFIGEDISFNVLAMTRDPLLIARERLAANITTLRAVDLRLVALAQLDDDEPTSKVFDGKPRTNGEIKDAPSAEEARANLATTNGLQVSEDDIKPTVGTSILLLGPSSDFGITEELLENHPLPKKHSNAITENTDPLALLDQRVSLMSEQAGLRRAYQEVQKEQRAAADRAEARKQEYGPLVSKWVQYLAQTDDPGTGKSALETLIQMVQ